MVRLILIMTAMFFSGLAAFGQRINYSGKNVKLENVFKELEKQSGYTFFYKTEAMRQIPKINVEIKNATIVQALEICLKNLPLTYTILEKTVVITFKSQTLLKNDSSNKSVMSGKVTDDQDNAIAGATVLFKNTKYATTTDWQGDFSLLVPRTNEGEIEVSSVGYITREMNFSLSDSDIVIRLKSNVSELDQVQVIGYGQTSRRFSTGDISSMNAATIAQQPVTNVLQAMENRMPGVNIVPRSGMPGSSYDISIQGTNSIGISNNPLYIVDGVPYPPGKISLLNYAVFGGNTLNYLDISSIESVSVLKDADATAIYGSRGANGVLLITTKRGKPGDMKLNVDAYTGFSEVATAAKFLSTPQYLQLRNEAHANDHTPVSSYDVDINGKWDTTRSTNWQHVFQGNPASLTRMHAGLSGGSQNTQYYIGGGYQRQTSVQLENGHDEMASMQFNVNTTSLNNKFNIFISSNFSQYTSTILPYDFSSTFYNMPPDAPPLYKPDGTLNIDSFARNPLLNAELKHKATINNLINNARISWHISKDLDFLITLGYAGLWSEQFLGTPVSYYTVSTGKTASSDFANYKNNTFIAEPQLLYKKKIGRGFLNSLLGATYQENISELRYVTASGFSSDALIGDLAAASKVESKLYRYSKYKYNAVFGRLNYNWKQKYIVDLNGRYDGSSRFGPDTQFHFFGSVGLAWIFSDEKWIREKLPFISFGKLRASYGTTGNDGLPDYEYLDTYDPTFLFMGVRGLYPSGLFNPDLAWELTKKTELGLDLGMFDDRILIHASYYRNRSNNMLLGGPVSSVTGFTNIYVNTPVTIGNNGWELELSTINIRRSHFTWTSGFNITIPQNKLISYPGLAISPYKDVLVEGQSINVAKVFRYAGVNEQNGLYQFYDRNGQITQNPDPVTDKTGVVNIGRKYYGALDNRLAYKNISLDFVFSFVNQYGPTSFSQVNGFLPGSGLVAMTPDFLSRWQKPGDKTNMQRMVSPATIQQLSDIVKIAQTARSSARAYGNASFIRLQNVSLSYECPQHWTKKMHIDNLKCFIQAQNLLTFTGYKTFDPETMNSLLPPLRTIAVGFSLTL